MPTAASGSKPRLIHWKATKAPNNTAKTCKPKGKISDLPHKAAIFVQHWTSICQPGGVYICDGSDKELDDIIKPWVNARIVQRIGTRKLGLLFRTSPKDAGNVFDSKTFFVNTKTDESTPPTKKGGAANTDFTADEWKNLDQKFMSSMAGRRMYVIPFQLGQAPDRLQLGVLLTDCPYVYVAMRMEVRISHVVWKKMEDKGGGGGGGGGGDGGGGGFIKWVHSMGCPRPSVELVEDHWPCDPSAAVMAFHPKDMRIKTYGGSALMPTTCLFPLVLDYTLDHPDSWMVAPYSILRIKTPHGAVFFVAMAMATGCDDTLLLAESKPCLSGYEVSIVAMNRMTYFWLDETGTLMAGNPLQGYSGKAVGHVNLNDTPVLARTLCYYNSLFLNAALRNKTHFLWRGMEDSLSQDDEEENVIKDWRGLPWPPEEGASPKRPGTGDAQGHGVGEGMGEHPDCRYYCLYSKYRCVHSSWGDPLGVPISAIVFGGKGPEGVPLVYECNSWVQGLLTGACLKTETVDRAQGCNAAPPADGVDSVTRDPMATNGLLAEGHLGKYLRRWLQWNSPSNKMPRVFHVNWWAKDQQHQKHKADPEKKKGDNPEHVDLQKSHKGGDSTKSTGPHKTWPGTQESFRVLDWILRRCDDHRDIATATPIGHLPRPGTINMSGLDDVKLHGLLSVNKAFWLQELARDKAFLETQVGAHVPSVLLHTLKGQEKALAEATDESLGLNPSPCSGRVPDKCYACLGPPFKTKTCQCSKYRGK